MENEETYTRLQWYDYVIFALTLLISIGIGIYYALTGGKQKTTSEFLVADRSMSVLPVTISLYVSGVSGILILGSTAEVYEHGILQWFDVIGTTLAYLITPLLFVPVFYKLGFTSAFTYLEVRFDSRAVKLLGSIMMITYQVLYCGLAMFSPATALEGVTGIPTWATILLLGLVVTIYSTIGGMKGVLGTDTFQGFVMVGGVLLILILGCVKTGGIADVWTIAKEGGRFEFETSPSPLVRMSIYSSIIGTFLSQLCNTTSQANVQRIIATASLKQAVMVFYWIIPLHLVFYSMCYLTGAVVFSYYDKVGCDPLATGQVSSSNQLLPYFLMNVIRIPGLTGLFIAILFCGALSSASSSLSSLAAVTWKEMLEKRDYFQNKTELQKTTVNKLLVFGYGTVSIVVAYLYGYMKGNTMQIAGTLVSSASAPVMALFILGLIFPCSEWRGAFMGCLVGWMLAMVLGVGSSIAYPYRFTLPTSTETCVAMNQTVVREPGVNNEDAFVLFRVAFGYYGPLTIAVAILVGLIFSATCFRKAKRSKNPDYYVSVSDSLCCCLPMSFRQWFCCGIPHEVEKSAEEDKSGELGDSNVGYSEDPDILKSPDGLALSRL